MTKQEQLNLVDLTVRKWRRGDMTRQHAILVLSQLGYTVTQAQNLLN